MLKILKVLQAQKTLRLKAIFRLIFGLKIIHKEMNLGITKPA